MSIIESKFKHEKVTKTCSYQKTLEQRAHQAPPVPIPYQYQKT